MRRFGRVSNTSSNLFPYFFRIARIFVDKAFKIPEVLAGVVVRR
jgi:hypothetical protein